MAIDMPTRPGFASSRFGLETNTQKFESPLTRNAQRVKLAGDRWRAEYTLPRMNRIQAAAWQAFLLSLEGQFRTFNAFDPDKKEPRGVATGTPLVNGGSQTGTSLVTDGWTPSVQGILKAGDFFSVNGELKMVTADVNSDSGGNATIQFMPALRGSPANNAALTARNATCTMILADDNQTLWESDHNGIYQTISFSALEVFE